MSFSEASSVGRTAIARRSLSRPIRDALRDRVIRPGLTVLDYGCGRGDDIRILRQLGYEAVGWDPIYFPQPQPSAADVVNLGYVLNVIADPQSRADTLEKAYQLCKRTLVVAAYVHNGVATKTKRSVPVGDGVVTGRGAFQKLFRHKELGDYIRAALCAPVECADFGVYYIRKELEAKVTQALPESCYGDSKEDLLIQFAASHFRTIGRSLRRELNLRQQEALSQGWATYQQLCEEAKALIQSRLAMSQAMRDIEFGKRTREAIYLHRSSLCFLPPAVKLEIAIAEALVNERYGRRWEVVKIPFAGTRISLLDTESFEQHDHPALLTTYIIDLESRSVSIRRESSENPSIYHRKELFVHPTHPLREAFAELTRQEEALGLLGHADIGRRRGWERRKATD